MKVEQSARPRRCRGHVAYVLSGGKRRKPSSPVQCVRDTRTLYNGVPYCGQHKGQAK